MKLLYRLDYAVEFGLEFGQNALEIEVYVSIIITYNSDKHMS